MRLLLALSLLAPLQQHMAALLPIGGKPNIVLIATDDAPTFMYRGWDSKHPFVADGINPQNAARSPRGTDIYIEHPTLDSLVSNGVSFLNHYAQPFCGPDRAAMWSGLWAHQSGVGSAPTGAWEFNTQPGYNGFVLLPEAMQALGYDTGICGKWHLNATIENGGTGWAHIPDVGKWDWYASTFSNFNNDMDPIGGPPVGDIEPVTAGSWTQAPGTDVWSRTQATGHLYKHTAAMVFDGVVYSTPEASAGAVTSYGQWHASTSNTITLHWNGTDSVDRLGKLDGGHYNYLRNKNGVIDTFQTTYQNPGGSPLRQALEVDNGDGTSKYSGYQVFTDASEFVAQAQEPFFLAITPNIPHIPSNDLYPTPDSKVITDRLRTGNAESGNDRTYATIFSASLEHHDTRLGEFIATMDPAVRARTMFIWTSDNGAPNSLMGSLRAGGNPGGVNPVPPIPVGGTMDFLIDQAENRMKNTAYEGSSRVPLVISGPLVSPSLRGRGVQGLSHTVDLYSTVIAMGGGVATGVAGVSQLPVIQAQSASERSELLLHKFRALGLPGDPDDVTGDKDADDFNEMGYTLIFTDKGALNGRYKLVLKYDGGGPSAPSFTEELYWLEDPIPADGIGDDSYDHDAWEEIDLFTDPAYATILGEMQTALADILAT